MENLNRGILYSGDFWGDFIRGEFFGEILFPGDFILQAFFCGGFYPRGVLSSGGFFPDTKLTIQLILGESPLGLSLIIYFFLCHMSQI